MLLVWQALVGADECKLRSNDLYDNKCFYEPWRLPMMWVTAVQTREGYEKQGMGSGLQMMVWGGSGIPRYASHCGRKQYTAAGGEHNRYPSVQILPASKIHGTIGHLELRVSLRLSLKDP